MNTRIVLSALAVAVATPAAAQTQNDAAWNTYLDEHRSPATAAALEWLLPTVGHSYAGNWKRGILPNVVGLAGVGVSFGVYIGCGDFLFGGSSCTAGQDAAIVVGLLVGAAGRLWSVASARDTARDHNRGLRERLGIETDFAVRPAPNGRMEFAATMQFR